MFMQIGGVACVVWAVCYIIKENQKKEKENQEMNKIELTTTFKQLRENGACMKGYNKLVRAVQNKPFTEKDEQRESYIIYKHDKPINLLTILESNGVDDCLWSLRVVIHNDVDKIARYCAMKCLNNFEQCYPNDMRPRKAIEACLQFANGEITQDELKSAAESAESAESAAWSAAWSAARSAAWSAAESAAESAWSAAESAAESAAR